MKEFAIDFASTAFIVIRYEEQKIEEEIFYKGEGYLSDDEFEFRKKVPPILTLLFNRSASSWNKRTPIRISISDDILSQYSTEIGNNIVLGIQRHENTCVANRPIS
jgi:hypothetical protein